jgi:hypothetical protein
LRRTETASPIARIFFVTATFKAALGAPVFPPDISSFLAPALIGIVA